MELQKVFFEKGIADFVMPDLSTKEKAQEFIGLDMKTLKDKKENWIPSVPPSWLQKAKSEGKLTAQL